MAAKKKSAKNKAKSKAKKSTQSSVSVDSNASQPASLPAADIESPAVDHATETAPEQLAELPTQQKTVLAVSTLVLAGVLIFLIVAAVIGDSKSSTSQILPSNTPGGNVPITSQSDSPLLQQTNPVQAAPAIDNGSPNGAIQPGGSGLQDQSPGLQ